MVDVEYEKEYLSRKRKLREFHSKLPQSRKNQEIYHKIMGSADAGEEQSDDSED